MKKELRLKVYNKFGGKCAYCGNLIEHKKFQIDHLHPQRLSHFYDSEKMKELYNLKGTNDDFENLMPSCRRCNHYKRAELLEDFRKKLLTLHKRIMKQYIVKVGLDYGIVKMAEWNGKFYFEQL